MPEAFGTPTYSSDGVVAAPHYLASLAGAEVLRDGGSAVDAAIAANLVMAVVWPHMCGPGGDLFAQVWSAGERKLFALNASGRAGRAMSAEAYQSLGLSRVPESGVLSITVPGAVDGWFNLHQRFGRLEMSRVARDAIHHARDGYCLTAFTASAIGASVELLARVGNGANVFAPNRHIPSAGDRLVQADLADSLEKIVLEGPGAMYGGEIGERVVAFLDANGGRLSKTDFAAHRSEWVEPVSATYRGVEVYELPPNSQGVALLEMLLMLDNVDLAASGLGSTELVHQLVERTKLAFADRDSYVADPACADVPLDLMLDPQRARARAESIGGIASSSLSQAVGSSASGDTIYLCAADRDGNVVSLIQSLYALFGSGVHVPGTGVTLHNRGSDFTLANGHPNQLAPGKRPLHTLMPGFAMRDGRPWLAFGTRGGDGQPQTCLQVLNGLLEFGLGLQEVVEAPRWAYGAPGDRFPKTALVLERRFDASVADDLAARGHEVMVADPVDPVMGTVQTIMIDQSRGCYIAATDPRGDGVALAI